jgi:hypothetical protein
VSHFRAHEWHHIAIDWDDENPAFPVRLYMDFQDMREEATPRMAQARVDSTANSWVRLNERQPRDGLQVGGIIREQGVDDAGVFKWFTNSTKTERGTGVETIAPSVKRILANATIDELVCYEGQFASIKQYYGATGSPGYFSVQPSEYANVFEVPLPPDVDHAILRVVRLDVLLPDHVHGFAPPVDRAAAQHPADRVRVHVQCGRRLERAENAGRAVATAGSPQRGVRPARVPAADGLRGNNAQFVYKMRMFGSISNVGNTAGGMVQTPVVDDVTLTYFLPSPRILLQEEAD